MTSRKQRSVPCACALSSVSDHLLTRDTRQTVYLSIDLTSYTGFNQSKSKKRGRRGAHKRKHERTWDDNEEQDGDSDDAGSSSLKPNAKKQRRQQDDDEDPVLDLRRSPSSSSEPHSPPSADDSPSDSEAIPHLPHTGHAADVDQEVFIYGLQTDTPLLNYKDTWYSSTWTDIMGTELLFSLPACQNEAAAAKHVPKTSRVKLVAQTAQIRANLLAKLKSGGRVERVLEAILKDQHQPNDDQDDASSPPSRQQEEQYPQRQPSPEAVAIPGSTTDTTSTSNHPPPPPSSSEIIPSTDPALTALYIRQKLANQTSFLDKLRKNKRAPAHGMHVAGFIHEDPPALIAANAQAPNTGATPPAFATLIATASTDGAAPSPGPDSRSARPSIRGARGRPRGSRARGSHAQSHAAYAQRIAQSQNAESQLQQQKQRERAEAEELERLEQEALQQAWEMGDFWEEDEEDYSD